MGNVSVHARSGFAYTDCHMPYVLTGSVKVSDHWVRSPLIHIADACQICHRRPEEELKALLKDIQGKTGGLLRMAEGVLLAAMDAIVKAKDHNL